MVKRQQFTAEFKREAVRQMRAGDKPISQLSRELGVPRNRLYKWNQAVEAHGEAEAFPGSGRRSAEHSELMRLRRALARAEQELEILKSAGVLRERTGARYAWIQAQQAAYPVTVLCRALGVSRSGFHTWATRAPSAREQADTRLAVVIRAAHMEHRQAYGTRRLWRVLVARGEQCGRHRVASLRRRHGIVTLRRRRFVRARAPYHRTPAAPRHLEWPFTSPVPNRAWVGDITHLPTREGWLYLAVIVDLCSRRVVGWAMDSQQKRDLAERALSMALLQRRPDANVVLHHDRGSQYTSARYRAKAEAAKIKLSMSRPGMPYDNAVAESFFSTLKLELAPDRAFLSREAARLAVFDYIEAFYNRARMHSALGYQSPAQYEERFNRLGYVP